MAFADLWIMFSLQTRKLTNLCRFWVALPVLAMTACVASTANTGAVTEPTTESVPTVQVADITETLELFLRSESDPLILLPHRLDRSKLDYSVDSLLEMDRWLADIHTINRLQSQTGKAGEILLFDGRGENSVVFAGLYLGQVIRTQSEVTWQWQRFDTFLTANPDYAEHYGAEPGLDTFILVGPQGAATPINTALKRVLYGKDESLHFIAQWLSKEVDLGTAMSSRDLLGMDRRDWTE